MVDVMSEGEFLTDDQLLEHNQRLRKKIADTITKNGVPEDGDSQYVLLTTLKDMDKQIIDKKRVAIDDKNANVANIVAEAVIKISNVFDNVDPFKRVSAAAPPVIEHDKIPEYEPVNGEMDIGIVTETFDEFMTVHGKNSKKAGIE